MADGSEPRAAEASHRTKGLVRLTMACNERCPFCNVPVEDYAEPEVDEAAIAEQVDAFVAGGERTLTISGGEPTLRRKRLVALVASARARGIPYVELQTNAVLVDAAYAGELASAGLTSAFVSLLSHVPVLHEELTGLKGSFVRCRRGIEALLDAGVRVTLNPVTARSTQALLPDYVDHVARELPRVRSISVSAVQPHGRGARNVDLLPDYAVLAGAIREARRRAAAAGIELLNPYCGLPVCVGWEGDLEHSVEAIEARGGGWRSTPGIENTGDKRHGPPCARCAVRTRCGGAWKAYWEVRGGSGLAAPVSTRPPWEGDPGPLAVVVDDPDRAPGDAPIVWWSTDRLVAGDDARLLVSAVTDLALETSPGILHDRAALRVLRRLATGQAGRLPQRRVRVHVAVHAAESPAKAWEAASVLIAVGVDELAFLGPRASDLNRLAADRWPEARVHL